MGVHAWSRVTIRFGPGQSINKQKKERKKQKKKAKQQFAVTARENENEIKKRDNKRKRGKLDTSDVFAVNERERERKREGRWTAEQIRDQAKQVTPPKLAALAERGRVVTRERSEKNEKERERENKRE